MDAFRLTGGCNCGAVRFELTAPPTGAAYCHCTRCQRRSGAAAGATAFLSPGSFRLLAGEDRLKSWTPDDGNEKWFCGECGSSVFTRVPGATEPAGVRMGSFDQDPGVRPSLRQFTAYAAPWEPIPDDGLPRYAERRPT